MSAHTKNAGMSMIEVVVWISMFSFVMLAIMNTVLYFYRTNDYAISQASAVSSAQRGIDHMVRSIREAAYAGDGAYPVVSMSVSQFTFYADTDNDSAIEKVHYYVSGTGLYEGIVQPAGDPVTYGGTEVVSQLSDNVRNLGSSPTTTLRYFDKNGAEVTDYSKIADVRFVTATLQVDVDPNRSPTPITLRSSAALRNLVGR